MSKFTDWLEEHQDEKCRKCPMFWSDGMYSECGCYIPMPIIKLAILKGNIKDYFYYKRWEKRHD